MRETERGESGQWLILFLGGEVAPAASTLVDQPAVYAPYGAIRRVRCSTAFPLLRDRVAPDLPIMGLSRHERFERPESHYLPRYDGARHIR